MGFMKQGVILMGLFFGTCGLAGYLSSWVFGLMLPVIWFFGFFHVHNLGGMSDEEFYSQEDSFNLQDWNLFEKLGQEKGRKFLAWALILIGCAGIWQLVTHWVSRILSSLGISDSIWYEITRNVPQVVFSVIIIYIGVQLIKGKKKELEDKEAANHDA